jgi:drug/metabolite transporter (DMT)-like permease
VLAVTARQRSSLPLAIMAGSLVSYHLLCHDASILIIPIAAALCSQSVWSGAVAALLLVGSFAAVIPQYGYAAAIPLLGLFVLSVGSTNLQVSLAGASTHARN